MFNSFCPSWSQSQPGVGRRGIINKAAMTITHEVLSSDPLTMLLQSPALLSNERISVFMASSDVWSHGHQPPGWHHVPCQPPCAHYHWQWSSVQPWVTLYSPYIALHESFLSKYYRVYFVWKKWLIYNHIEFVTVSWGKPQEPDMYVLTWWFVDKICSWAMDPVHYGNLGRHYIFLL